MPTHPFCLLPHRNEFTATECSSTGEPNSNGDLITSERYLKNTTKDYVSSSNIVMQMANKVV